MQFELIWRFFQLLGVRTRIGYFTQIQLSQFQDRQNVTHNQTTQLHKLLISRDSHGYPNDLLEKVIIFHHFPGAPTDLLEKIREVVKKSKWKFLMAFAIRGGSRGGHVCH